jgi:hypothetical protein
MTLSDMLINVWREALVEGAEFVRLNGRRYPVEFTKAKHLRTVAFRHQRRQIFGVEQNPKTQSRWAALARKGKRIMQFSVNGRYVANVCEGKLLKYPAWRAVNLPE